MKPIVFTKLSVMMLLEYFIWGSFYDGYVVNAVPDAAYRSAKSKLWEPVTLDIWRGRTGVSKDSHLTEYDADHYLVKKR